MKTGMQAEAGKPVKKAGTYIQLAEYMGKKCTTDGNMEGRWQKVEEEWAQGKGVGNMGERAQA
jgi:hypothetical protein